MLGKYSTLYVLVDTDPFEYFSCAWISTSPHSMWTVCLHTRACKAGLEGVWHNTQLICLKGRGTAVSIRPTVCNGRLYRSRVNIPDGFLTTRKQGALKLG